MSITLSVLEQLLGFTFQAVYQPIGGSWWSYLMFHIIIYTFLTTLIYWFHQLSVWKCDGQQSRSWVVNKKSIFCQYQSNINCSSTLSLKLWRPAEQNFSCQSKINLSSTSIKHQFVINSQFEIGTASRAKVELSIKNQSFININQTSTFHQLSIWDRENEQNISCVINL